MIIFKTIPNAYNLPKKTSAEAPNGDEMSIGMQRWIRRIKNIYKTAICGLPGEMPGYGGTLFNLFQT